MLTPHQAAQRNLFSAKIAEQRKQTLRPKPRINLVEWADTHRKLSAQSSAVAGQWNTERVEVARGPMHAVTERGVSTITVMCCTQLMKTSLLENIIGYHTHQDPCPMLLTQPKDESVRAFSKERLMPMMKETPVLRAIMGNTRTRTSDDTINFKEFPGGFLAMASAGSPSNLAMRAIRLTLLDEIDKYETTKEGDPIALAEERTATFAWNRLRVRTCSPTLVETSRIYRSFLEGDQRRPMMQCPHCEHWQTLRFFKRNKLDKGGVNWEKAESGEGIATSAHINCENCEAVISESERVRACTTKGMIRWFQTRKFTCCDEEQDPQVTRSWRWDEHDHVGRSTCKTCGKLGTVSNHASFQASKLFAPQTSVVEIAEKWFAAKGDGESEQTFYNTQLGEPFEQKRLVKADVHTLEARSEKYEAELPDGVLLLTVGVDVQAGGVANEGSLHIEVVGWGIGEESWSLAHEVFRGNPSEQAVWKRLYEFYRRRYKRKDGQVMVAKAMCVDSGGHNTQDVYNFCRPLASQSVWAIKGSSHESSTQREIWTIPKQDLKTSRAAGYRPQIIGVSAAKEIITRRFAIEEPGPGYCHFPEGRPRAYFDQLTAETQVTDAKGKRTWVLPRGRTNEAFDIRVYAYAALHGLVATRGVSLPRLAARASMGIAENVGEAPAAPGQDPVQARLDRLRAKKAARNRVRKSSFMG